MDETRRLIERARRNTEEAGRAAAENKRLLQTSRELKARTAVVQGRLARDAATVAVQRLSNRLLALLPAAEFDRLLSLLEPVDFAANKLLIRAEGAVDHLYFPLSGLLSARIVVDSGAAIEIAPIGNEGLVGLMAYYGNNVSPHDVVVQIPGQGLKIGVQAFRAEVQRGGRLPEILNRYHSACVALGGQQIACNGLHSLRKRCCRRLLSTQDRVQSDVLPLTHEALALTLGVRRPSVTEGLGSLQDLGIVDIQRSRIRVVDRPRLLSLACECYEADNEIFARLFGNGPTKVSAVS